MNEFEALCSFACDTHDLAYDSCTQCQRLSWQISLSSCLSWDPKRGLVFSQPPYVGSDPAVHLLLPWLSVTLIQASMNPVIFCTTQKQQYVVDTKFSASFRCSLGAFYI